ncbi:MAG: hypothetical protein HOA57_00040 [Candidatus Magasanikbacteria bacterium]|nr:hypothetical protein [Candidatus Magasanikbacteria bacterium]MBT4315086.1 hypothetical protein [Candidatus Magasanikbacteria bacterium]MBT4546996.1 hypothetical protein [Candidatus Magasanikbacteria bacterium]MBT6818766.1 hypothetical protein [Candidatus Magasanikbacteria bacterium]
MPSPRITKVEPILEGNTFLFTGVAIPNQEVIVYINSEKTLVYRTLSDSMGMWNVNHSQDVVELKPGEHSIFAVSVDRKSKVKTPIGALRLFDVQKSIWVTMYNYLNLQTTIISIIFLLVAILFLYRIKQKESVKL